MVQQHTNFEFPVGSADAIIAEEAVPQHKPTATFRGGARSQAK
jgi:hypothetical protein